MSSGSRGIEETSSSDGKYRSRGNSILQAFAPMLTSDHFRRSRRNSCKRLRMILRVNNLKFISDRYQQHPHQPVRHHLLTPLPITLPPPLHPQPPNLLLLLLLLLHPTLRRQKLSALPMTPTNHLLQRKKRTKESQVKWQVP